MARGEGVDTHGNTYRKWDTHVAYISCEFEDTLDHRQGWKETRLGEAGLYETRTADALHGKIPLKSQSLESLALPGW